MRRAAALALVVAAWLAGCAAPGLCSTGDALSGRLSVRIEADAASPVKSMSSSFELHGDASAGQFSLSSTLGTTLAQAQWSTRQPTLVTADGRTDYRDLDALTRDMLGESIPVAALFDWLRGRPWNGAPSRPLAAPADKGFLQLGWSVSLARFDEGWVTAQRLQPPQVTVRARVDRP